MAISYKDFYSNDAIHIWQLITEANAGYIDHPDFNRVLKEILDKIYDELGQFKSNTISELHPYISVNYTLKTYRYKETLFEPDAVIKQPITIQISPEIKNPEKTEDLIVLGATYFDTKTFTIKIGINNKKLVSDILDNTNKIESVMSHELVHIFQNIYGNYKKTQAHIKREMDRNDGELYSRWYWTNRKEIEAYTTNINVELRQIKKEIPDIKFKSAMLKIGSWKHLNKFVPKEYNHLLSQILRKVVHHWQHNLGGKLNEFTIKLK
jgi:hypothetical protein